MLPSVAVIASFSLVVGLLTVTPGLDTALVLRSAAVGGKRRAFGVIAGIQTGTLIWGFLAAIGVSALLLASAQLYDVIRLIGAAYLIWMGGRMLWSTIHGTRAAASSSGPIGDDSFFSGWRQGALTNLLNPKMGAFYVAILPQFIPESAPHLMWGLTLAGVHVLLGTAWLSALALVAQRFSRWLQRRKVARTIDGVTGTVLIGFGVGVAMEGAPR
ncbi:LysE family translocator [Mycetocola reblochoni]|uniref:LysE family translocator n=2 Tax=Mycetocola reblochoni TaxID=331618 RepID=A0A3L6ZTP2_9MICO|nr:LysE family translocator [Mycetocola reblochoni]RLP71254.1 LysE family translocator [Mycetocola reblochoni]SJN42139.1 Putative threonine efflux protein [Mycetocola reblochoni REB411]